MKLASEQVDFDSPAGAVSAYLTRPAAASGPLPGVLVIQEIWGVDRHIEDVADRFAGAGYVAFAPDLYSVGGGRPQVLGAERVESAKVFLNTIPPAQWMAVLGDDRKRAEALSELPDEQARSVGETIGALFGGAGGDSERHLSVLRAAIAFLRAHTACAARAVGSVGFCLGGSLSALLACEEPQLGAAVVYYGASPADERVGSIHCPLRGFYGQDDPRIVGGLPAFEQALSLAGADHELRIYPDTGHAFFNDTRPSYRPEAARDAWSRTLAFFAETLAPLPTMSVPGQGAALEAP
ncbi:MAG TPA: dienelactone hydrolase family protein [Solirubrobacteraceae bacterium]|jgi:carboxymethylenebutenolidase|nr:dienelactone hydrolase family protein [Solirubrobacteraceae bacterium]